MRNGEASERELLRTSRLTAIFVPVFCILVSIVVQNANIAILVAVPLVFAASALVPVILLTIYWKKFNRYGAITGMLTGLIVPLALLLVSPATMGENALFPLPSPGLVTVPLGFLACYIGAMFGASRSQEEQARGLETPYDEFYVRVNTGIGSTESIDSTDREQEEVLS